MEFLCFMIPRKEWHDIGAASLISTHHNSLTHCLTSSKYEIKGMKDHSLKKNHAAHIEHFENEGIILGYGYIHCTWIYDCKWVSIRWISHWCMFVQFRSLGIFPVWNKKDRKYFLTLSQQTAGGGGAWWWPSQKNGIIMKMSFNFVNIYSRLIKDL